MYNANIEVQQLADLTKLKIKDLSTGDETITSRTITLYKTDLVPLVVTLNEGETETEVGGFSKDYALKIVFNASVDAPVDGSVYEKEIEVVMTGHSDNAFRLRHEALEIDETIVDKISYMSTTLEVEYYISNAKVFGLIGDLVKAQKSLNYVQELTGY